MQWYNLHAYSKDLFIFSPNDAYGVQRGLKVRLIRLETLHKMLSIGTNAWVS